MRAGKPINQLQGDARYKAFVPNPLPFKIDMSPDLQARLSEADQALGRLDGIAETLPDVDFFVLMYVSKEATYSSQVEGTQATFTDLLKAEARIQDAEIHSDVDEIQNYIKAMNYGLKRLETLPLSLRLIREIHKKLLAGVRGQGRTPGTFRKTQNWIGGRTIAEASFVPPPAHEMMALLYNLEKYMHDPAPTPLLLKAAFIHSQFEAIHPFLDGNGRVGRLLVTFYLCQQEALQKPLLYLSEFFRTNRREYYERLNGVHEKDDLEGWLSFFLEGVDATAKDSVETVRKVVDIREHDLQAITASGAAGQRALSLLNHLYRNPMVRIKEVEELLALSNPGAIGLINKFVKLGILEEITGRQRDKVFAYSCYMDAFSR